MNLETLIRRGDGDSTVHSRRTSRRHPTRSLCQGTRLEETIKNNPPHLLPQPPESDGKIHLTKAERIILKEEFYGGNTYILAQLALGNPTPKLRHTLTRLNKDLVLGGSSRITRPCGEQEMSVARAPSSLPTSPSSGINESHASKLLKNCKPSGPALQVDDEIAKPLKVRELRTRI
uniref:Uncharacterized protein n=1 Tax=Physcomitrium patens TaxID=3218 RepID=A0A2K1KCT6_PHYPA|nr:hypothetical protein PHYPA_010781 [Physcomitrium patens]